MADGFPPSNPGIIATGLINRLQNAAFALNPEGTTSPADTGTVFVDWSVLTQTAAIQTSQLAAPEPGQSYAIRITQTQSTAQRFGLAQSISFANCADLRTSLMSASGRVRFSTPSYVRFALLEWDGTADASPVDVVHDWTSTLYVPGQFFVSSVSVLNTGIWYGTETQWSSLPYIPLQGGPRLNNLIFFVWTQDAVSQSATLDLGALQVSLGNDQPYFEHRPLQLEQAIINVSYPLVVDIRQFGARTSSPDNQAAIEAAVNVAGPHTVFIPDGTWLTSKSTFNNLSGVTILGESRGGAIVKTIQTIAETSHMVWQFISATDTYCKWITFDSDNIVTTAANTVVASFNTSTNAGFIACDCLRFKRLGLGYNGGTNLWFTNNRFLRTSTEGTYQNESIFGSVSAGAVQTVFIEDNIISGSGIIVSGNDITVARNDIDGFGYGAGITINADASSNRSIIAGNHITGGVGTDINLTNCEGIECWAPRSVICGNVCWNNSGPGLAVGSSHSVVSNNVCFDNGQTAPGDAGISAAWQDGTFNASYTSFIGNVCFDTGGGTQLYGYGEQSGRAFAFIRLESNQFFGSATSEYLFSTASVSRVFSGDKFEATATWNPASVADKASANTTITVTGAALGDYALCSFSLDLQGLTIAGYVSSSNTVTAVLSNLTGGPVDLASGTLRAKTIRPSQ